MLVPPRGSSAGAGAPPAIPAGARPAASAATANATRRRARGTGPAGPDHVRGGPAALAAPASEGDVTLPVVRLAVGIDPVAELASNRVVARVPVDVICLVPGARTADVSLSVTQAVGERVATGDGFVPGGVSCDGRAHRLTVGVVASAGGAAFRIGGAAVTASVSACPEDGEGACESVDTEPQDHLLLEKLRF